MSILTVSGLTKSYDPFFTVGDRTFRVARGGTIGSVGVNGANTSTWFGIIAGVEVPTCAGVHRAQTTRIVSLAQDSRVVYARTLADAMPPALRPSRRLRNRSCEGGL
jgi:ATPase subunit of ABC transporter with duplicated ATPase domains